MRALYNIFDHIFDLNDVHMLYIMHNCFNMRLIKLLSFWQPKIQRFQ